MNNLDHLDKNRAASWQITHAKSVRRITSHSLTLVKCLTLSDNFVLLHYFERYHTNCHSVSIQVRQSTRLTNKLMLSRVQVKRIKSDIPACNFNRNDLEIAGDLASLARRRSNDRAWISSLSRRILSSDAVIFSTTPPFWHGGRALKAGETIPAILLFTENQVAVRAKLGKLKHRAA